MKSEIRWIVLSCMLGLLTAYVIWGHGQTATVPLTPAEPATVPVATTTAATTNRTTITNTNQIKSIVPPNMTEAKVPDTIHGLTDLVFEPDVLDFGSVPVNDKRTKSILVKNPTDHPIAVKELHPSCHCISLKMDKTVIEPGKSEPIDVEFNAIANRKSEMVAGYFKTDEKGAPTVNFKVHGVVVEEILVDPPIIQFHGAYKQEVKTQEVTVKSADGKPFEIKSVKGEHPEFTYTYHPVENTSNSQYKLLITMKAVKSGPLGDKASIATDRARTPVIILYISASTGTDLVLSPPAVSAEIKPDGFVTPFVVEIRHRVPGRLEVLDVLEGFIAAHRLALKYDIERINDETVKLSIQFTDKFSERAPYGQFQIKTNIEEDATKLPFRVNGAQAKPNFPGVQ